MGGKGGFAFLLVQTFLVNTIPEVFLDENSQRKDVNTQSKTTSIQQNTIMKSITYLNDAFDLFFEGGTVRLRLKEGITRETLLDEKLVKHKILIPENHPWPPL